jgi:hypothetical protein
MSDFKSASPRGLDVDQLRVRLGGEKPLDRSTIWRRIRRDSDFPKPFYLWDAAPRWVEEEIDDYIRKKIAQRNDPVAADAQRERVEHRKQRISKGRARALERAQKAKARAPRRRSKNHPQTPNTS